MMKLKYFYPSFVWLQIVCIIRNVAMPGRVVHAWDTPAQRAINRQRVQHKKLLQRVNDCFVSTTNGHYYQEHHHGGVLYEARHSDSTNKQTYSSLMQSMKEDFLRKIYSQIYDTQPPRDILYGFLSAASNFWNGYSNAFSIIISYPWEGYARDGLVGVVQDSVVGLVSGAVVAASGAVAGLSQFALGISNTVKSSLNRQMYWDTYRRQWTTSPCTLEEERIEIEQLLWQEEQICSSNNRKKSQQPKDIHKRPARKIKDMSYYNMLKLRVDATNSDIKKAYYREAKKVHPDKTKDDARAAIKFHKLKSVYDTLMDDEKREAYDTSDSAFCFENDIQNTQDATLPDLDADVFFTVFFGSLSVEPYIGQLAIASIVDNLIQTSDSARAFNDLNEGSKKLEGSLEQRKRRVEVALHLRDRVNKYASDISNDAKQSQHQQYQQQFQDDFRTSCRIEAEYIGRGNFGDIFLQVIGSVLKSESEQFLGDHSSLLRVKGYALRAHIHSVDLVSSLSYAFDFSIVRKSVKAYFPRAQEGEAAASESEVDDNTTECNGSSKRQLSVDKIFQERSTRDLLLKVVWKYNAQDITSTLRAACNLLFSENAPLNERLKRAEAIRTLGEEFISMSKKINEENSKQSKDKQYTAWAEAAILQASVATDL